MENSTRCAELDSAEPNAIDVATVSSKPKRDYKFQIVQIEERPKYYVFPRKPKRNRKKRNENDDKNKDRDHPQPILLDENSSNNNLVPNKAPCSNTVASACVGATIAPNRGLPNVTAQQTMSDTDVTEHMDFQRSETNTCYASHVLTEQSNEPSSIQEVSSSFKILSIIVKKQHEGPAEDYDYLGNIVL